MLFALLVALFAIQNADFVNIRFFAWQFQGISLVLVILGSAVAGAFIIFVAGAMKQFKMAWKIRDTEGKVRKLETELTKVKEEKEDEENKLQFLQKEFEQLKKALDEGEARQKELAGEQCVDES